jgi:primosomal protein N' (replication factor Y)
VVVGTRIGVVAPAPEVGLVIVDEEHDPSYKSERTPRYQARDTAIELGRLSRAPVILGSATPDVASLGRARAGEFEHFALPDRVAGARPEVEIVDLRAELGAGNRGLLSRRLASALGELDTRAGEQAILMINRRGAASVVLCRDCGYVQICPECQRPLVFHSTSVSLRCHHCGATAPAARRCPACNSPRIRYLGGGTERVEREVALRFPTLRVGRLDRDIVERRGAAVRVMDSFAAGRFDVLVGTALVAKGIDIPQVTLVGVVSADVSLNLPDERAAERTYQLLAQAVGRAGRGDRPGHAILQTYIPDHPVVRAVASGNAADFYDAELESRRLFRSPPYGRIIKLTVALEDRDGAEKKGVEMAERLRARAADADADVEVLGPAPAYIARRGGKWRFHVVLRGDRPLEVLGSDPGVPWSVDVDPESLL